MNKRKVSLPKRISKRNVEFVFKFRSKTAMVFFGAKTTFEYLRFVSMKQQANQKQDSKNRNGETQYQFPQKTDKIIYKETLEECPCMLSDDKDTLFSLQQKRTLGKSQLYSIKLVRNCQKGQF